MIPTWTPTKRKYGKSGPSSPHVQNSTPPSSGPIRVLARHQRSLRRTWRLRDRSDAPPLPASTPIPPQPLAAPVCQACGPGTETSNPGQCGRCALFLHVQLDPARVVRCMQPGSHLTWGRQPAVGASVVILIRNFNNISSHVYCSLPRVQVH